MTSTITEGFIGTTFFGCEDLGSTNSAKLALEGFSYTHAMSFFAHPNYLGGEGYGSSYILELYADFGVGGIAVGSLLLSCALRALSCAMGRSWFWGTVALISSMSVFHMPRGTALEWISFLWATRFLLAVVLVMVGAALLAYVGRVLRTRTRHVGKVGVLAGCSSCQWEAAEAARPLVMGETDGGSARNKFGVRVCPIVRSE